MIYYVEDEKNIRELVEYALLANGFEIKCFSEGAALWQELRKDVRPELILLDIMLPGENGLEILHRLKGDGKTKDIPVIMVTAKGSEYDKVLGLDSGADDYIAKPFDMLALMVRMEKVLKRSGKLNEIYHFRNLTLDNSNRRLHRNGEEINLTPLEFDVLAVLMKNKNRTVSRERILNEIWGQDYFGDIRTVDVRIANLRKKLGLAEEIRTISKAGYRLEER